MDKQSSNERRVEGIILSFLLLFLGINAFVNASYGFSLPLFLGTVPISAILAFVYPRAGIIAALLLTIFFERFFTLQSIWIGNASYKLYPLDIILIAVLISVGLSLLQNETRKLRFRPIDLWLSLFFIYVTIIFLISIFGLTETSGAVAFSTWKNYVFYGLSGLILVGLLHSREDLIDFGRLLFWGTVVASLFLLIGILRGEGLWTEFTPLSTTGTRILAFPHAFYFSLTLLSLLLSLPVWWNRIDSRAKHLLSSFIVLLAVGILGSLMRHLWLGISATIIFALIISPAFFGRSVTVLLIRFIFPLAILLSGAWFVASLNPDGNFSQSLNMNIEALSDRVISIGSDTDESFAWRSEVWESALQRFEERPWTGIGFGVSVPVELGEYRQYVEVRNMHNSWLALLIQTGLIGAVLMMVFLVVLTLMLWRTRFSSPEVLQTRFVLTGLLLFQSLVFFSQPYLETNLLGLFFWMTLGTMRVLLEFDESRDVTEIVNG